MRRLELMTYREVAEALRHVDTLIIPVGTIEAHGAHLPLGTDALIPLAIAERIAERVNALVAPPIYYGVTRSLLAYPGSLTISEKTLEQLVYEIICAARRHGFRFFVIINGHGGNRAALSRAAVRAWLELGCYVMVIHWWVLAQDLTRELLGAEPAHAGADETAAVMVIDERLVKLQALTADEAYLVRTGVECYPEPGSLLTYKPGAESFEVNREKARKWFERVVDEIAREVLRFKERALRLAHSRELSSRTREPPGSSTRH